MKDKYHLTKEENLFLAKNIYNSVRFEGINTTYSDIKTILEGVNVPTLKLDEINCILNLWDAWKFTLTNKVNLDFIGKINSFVSRNESLEWVVLRNGQVDINGVDYIPSIPIKEEVSKKIEEILSEDNEIKRSIYLMLYLMRSKIF